MAYQEVEKRKQGQDTYNLTDFNLLSNLVLEKLPSAKYVHVEALWEPELDRTIFSLMFYDDDNEDEESIGGLELTPFKIIWDDDESTA
jgi:hypothetical protein